MVTTSNASPTAMAPTICPGRCVRCSSSDMPMRTIAERHAVGARVRADRDASSGRARRRWPRRQAPRARCSACRLSSRHGRRRRPSVGAGRRLSGGISSATSPGAEPALDQHPAFAVEHARIGDVRIVAEAVQDLLQVRLVGTVQTEFGQGRRASSIAVALHSQLLLARRATAGREWNTEIATAVRNINPTVSKLSLVSSPIRTGGRSSVDTVSPESGDMRRNRRRPIFIVVLGGPGAGAPQPIVRAGSRQLVVVTKATPSIHGFPLASH